MTKEKEDGMRLEEFGVPAFVGVYLTKKIDIFRQYSVVYEEIKLLVAANRKGAVANSTEYFRTHKSDGSLQTGTLAEEYRHGKRNIIRILSKKA